MRIPNKQSGFTILEMLLVILIIGILSIIVLVALDQSKEKGDDAALKSQAQEILKSFEIYYTDYSQYPDHGSGQPDGSAYGYFGGMDTTFYLGTGKYLTRLPVEIDRFFYCVSPDRGDFVLAVNTFNDKGGTNWCHIRRGPGPNFGCDYINDLYGTGSGESAADTCASRF